MLRTIGGCTQVFMLCLGLGLALTPVEPSHAVGSYKRALNKKMNSYMNDGVIIGGKAGRGFSLLKVRRDISKPKGLERIILDIGDHRGRPLLGGVGFFHATVEKKPARVVIHLSQMSRSGVTEARLRKIFGKSPYIKSIDLTADPEDNTATIVLNLRSSMGVEVFKLVSKNRASRIIIDLKKTRAKKSGSTKRAKVG